MYTTQTLLIARTAIQSHCFTCTLPLDANCHGTVGATALLLVTSTVDELLAKRKAAAVALPAIPATVLRQLQLLQ
jgi:hypothetical protein